MVTAEALGESAGCDLRVIDVLEGNRRYMNLQPLGEPQLGRRGLFRALSGNLHPRSREYALLWVLNLSDGHHTLLDIAERSGLPFAALRDAASVLVQHDLLEALAEHDEGASTLPVTRGTSGVRS